MDAAFDGNVRKDKSTAAIEELDDFVSPGAIRDWWNRLLRDMLGPRL